MRLDRSYEAHRNYSLLCGLTFPCATGRIQVTKDGTNPYRPRAKFPSHCNRVREEEERRGGSHFRGSKPLTFSILVFTMCFPSSYPSRGAQRGSLGTSPSSCFRRLLQPLQ